MTDLFGFCFTGPFIYNEGGAAAAAVPLKTHSTRQSC
jgi:hypothetical protein